MTVRLALRRAARSPLHVVLMVAVMAATVGSTGVVASLANALWLRPRPVPNPDRVVNISSVPVHGEGLIDMLKAADLQRLEQAPVFEAIAGQISGSLLLGDFTPSLSYQGSPLETLAVTPGYFDVLGVAVRGDGFRSLGSTGATDELIVISHGLWQRTFEADASLIGRTIETSLGMLRVAGIAPRGFEGARLGERAEAWVPYTLSVRRGIFRSVPDAEMPFMISAAPFVGLGRLSEGVDLAQAERAVSSPRSRIRLQPLSTVYGAPGQASLVVQEERFIRLTGVACLFVLLAGCATLSSLLLADYEKRRGETAVRMALGGSRATLFRDMAVELGMLAALGVLASLAVTLAGVRLLTSITLPGGIELGRLDLALDWRVIAMTIGGLALVTALAAAGALMRYTRPSLALGVITGTSTGSRSALRFRRAMSGMHAAATYVLLLGAILFVQTILRGFDTGAGFEVDRTIFVRLQPSVMQPFRTEDERAAAVRALRADLEALPASSGVAMGNAPIGEASVYIRPVAIDDGARQITLPLSTRAVDPAYGSTIGLRMAAGRPLSPGDLRTSAAVITASLAASVWPDAPIEGAVGRVVSIDGVPREIVGVVRDFAQGTMRGNTAHGVLVPAEFDAGRQAILPIVVSTHVDARVALQHVRDAVDKRFPAAARLEVRTGRQLVERDLARERLSARVLAGFGVIALILGVAGTYGLVHHTVAVRWKDLGIRMSLGALPQRLGRDLVVLGMWPVGVGLAAGVLLTAAGATFAGSLVLDFARPSVIHYMAAAAILASGAAGAALLGARRIRHLTPASALRAL